MVAASVVRNGKRVPDRKRRAFNGEFSVFPSICLAGVWYYFALLCYLDKGSVGAHRILSYGTTLDGELSSSWFLPIFDATPVLVDAVIDAAATAIAAVAIVVADDKNTPK